MGGGTQGHRTGGGHALSPGHDAVDFVVIGGGIAGLSLVWHLTRRHGIEAVALDAGKIGWGASGRNGGFVSMGYTKRSLDELARSFGWDDARTVFEMVTAGAANSRVFELRAPMMVKNRYDGASMKLSVWQKDMAVIGDFARRLAVPTPLFDATVPVYRRALRTGHAGHDTAAVCAVLEAMAGVKRGKQRTQHVKLAENRKVGKGA